MAHTLDAVETEDQPVKKPLRITELILLVMAVAIGSGAYMLSGLGMDQPLDTHYWIQLGVMAALAVAFHIVLRLRAPWSDQYIMPLALSLNGLGLAMIHRLDLVPPGGNAANNQLLWTALSIIISMALVWFIIDYRTCAASPMCGCWPRRSCWSYRFCPSSAWKSTVPAFG